MARFLWNLFMQQNYIEAPPGRLLIVCAAGCSKSDPYGTFSRFWILKTAQSFSFIITTSLGTASHSLNWIVFRLLLVFLIGQSHIIHTKNGVFILGKKTQKAKPVGNPAKMLVWGATLASCSSTAVFKVLPKPVKSLPLQNATSIAMKLQPSQTALRTHSFPLPRCLWSVVRHSRIDNNWNESFSHWIHASVLVVHHF